MRILYGHSVIFSHFYYSLSQCYTSTDVIRLTRFGHSIIWIDDLLEFLAFFFSLLAGDMRMPSGSTTLFIGTRRRVPRKSMAQVDSFITRRVKSTGSMFRKRKKYAKWNANLCLLTQRIFVIIFSIKQVVSGLLLLAIQTHGSYNLRAKFYHPIELLCTSSSRAL